MASSPFTISRTVLMASAFGLAAFVAPHHAPFNGGGALVSTAYAEDALGQDVGGHLQQAQKALSAHNLSQAMEAVDAADAVKNKSSYEAYVIAQMRAAVAAQSGNASAALKAYDVLINSARTPAASKKQMLMAQASMAYSARDYASAAKAAARYTHDYGADPQMQTLLVQCYYLQQDWKGTIAAVRGIIAADQKAKRTPAESQLQMMATAYGNLRDLPGQTNAYVQLVKYYPRTQYWQILIHNLVSDQSLSPRLVFNLQRLRLATGVLTNPSDFQDMAERAVQMGLPQLALNLLNEGYNRHLLGTGPAAGSQEHFRSFVAQQAAKTRNELPAAVQEAGRTPTAGPSLTAGYNLILNGQVDQGLALIQQGQEKKPRFPDIAQLEKGMALIDAGRKADAVTLLSAMNGDGVVNDLAQLWAVYLRSAAAR
ncbi:MULTISPECIES: hypothetical protein [unclassified Saccharibacter]|uniref:hypothetical protein n=1 Tax=unclassified Saccharibacter TaxID=2648722 RepID=UPI00132933A4|nr:MULTISPECIES: hypothetical protein [unclassified Saccharibacter]MXV36965.1 hypothetical protein [Saccharibacter sp. EH611]MXV58545.1 hypothetical protein [Saccharibacter sp. EH70]MXV66051.1 hypothetical protein [Saccharibacter sp. EH60]